MQASAEPRGATMARLLAAAGATALLASCGGGSSGGTATTTGTTPVTVTPTPSPTPSPTPTPTPTPASTDQQVVSRSLNIDLGNLDNYANPALPAFYNNAVFRLDNAPPNNPITDPVATLGRVLFYDKKLSINDTVACASCHQQSHGFEDTKQFSVGFAGGLTAKHAMRLGNVRFYQPGTMFWDKRAASVEDQASQPIVNPVEMGWDANAGGIAALLTKMQGIDYYPVLFNFAFGSATITEARMQTALAQFERAMISSHSRFDTGYAQVFDPTVNNNNLGANFPGFTASENRGKQLFLAGPNNGGAGCAACHVPPSFALSANSRSNGLDAGETTVFKAPSLKNIGLSQFFMHDGRFTTLLQVIDHYDSGVQLGPALDNRLQPGGRPQRLNLSAADKQALVDFLGTLTDTTLSSDPRFSDPFIN